jgi:hypothetical protein
MDKDETQADAFRRQVTYASQRVRPLGHSNVAEGPARESSAFHSFYNAR